MKKKHLFYTVVVSLLIVACQGCDSMNPITDIITRPTAREQYARTYKDSVTLFEPWQAAYNLSKLDSLEVALPYGEKGFFQPEGNAVYTYNIVLQEGEVLEVAVQKDSAAEKVFSEVLQQRDSVWKMVAQNDNGESAFEYVVNETGIYKVTLQPEIKARGGFFISLTKRPQYGFPVAGKGNADIGSFWGMERDGGARAHEGIDIFAKRGTPVVAATSGTVSYTGERGLGGKQVWLRDGLFGKSLYYAHLDSIAVGAGAHVKAGDTLGFVGNTGNAKTTVPHLHFGIYKYGAVNPLPYVYKVPPLQQSSYTYSFNDNVLKVKTQANLRQGPGMETATIGRAAPSDALLVLGQHHDWMHVKTHNGTVAFLHKSLLKEAR
ncbi:peptidoglycan DD-metalloendopeptidase family protein [Flavobacterium sp. RHBU_24]|uniref:peptidoglycan DD-metalloendopeptidase family protein n=1 Tax=Flavobacterium sp. RHBU_24 TaxID=3391185 RepID=UPI003984CBFE